MRNSKHATTPRGPSNVLYFRLWFQLGEKLLELSHSVYFLTEGRTLSLLQTFVVGFKDRLNRLALAQFIVAAVHQAPDVASGTEILQKELNDVENMIKQNEAHHEEAVLLLKLQLAIFKVKLGFLKEGKDILSDASDVLKGHMTPIVHAKFYEASMEFNKAKGSASNYFKNALLFLSYGDFTHVSGAQKVALASELCHAALVGEDIYNFGELVCLSIRFRS
jgi:26S proteasome regulatory subunit N9